MTVQTGLEAMLRRAAVIPVVVIEDLAHAVPMARALVAGGLPVMEITLRTPVALDAIRAIAAEVQGAIPGAGTVLRPSDLVSVQRAGAHFAVSPGSSPALLDADDDAVPLLPGAATASEAMQLAERGYKLLKCFPAAAIGGPDLLRSLAGPLPCIRFCATGGISAATAPAYLSLPNVLCVGGSWLTPKALLDAGDWHAVERLAHQADKLR